MHKNPLTRGLPGFYLAIFIFYYVFTPKRH